MSQGWLSRIALGAKGLRRVINWWPPFLGAGIRVREIAPDFRSATVELRMSIFNHLPEERIAEVRAATASGEKVEPVFRVDIVDGEGVTVADVEKTLHIRKRRS